MKARAVFLLLAIFLVISCAGAAEVTLTVPQRDYYARPGESATIPVTILSTYDHDVTGTLKQVMVPVGAGTAGPGDATMQSAELAAFTEQRTVPIATRTSATAGDYLLTLLFSYPDGGGRTVVLDGIRVHFITNPDKQSPQPEPVKGTDIKDPAAAPSSAGSSPEEKTVSATPQGTPFVSQEAQDTSALKEQLARESNGTQDERDERERYIFADPLVIGRDRSLKGAGFALNRTDISPLPNNSATFVLTYASGARTSAVRGYLEDTRVLFAEESAKGAVPLPDALEGNASFREYTNRTAEYAFTRSETRINATPGRETVNLTFTNPAGRTLRFDAQVENGTIVALEGESPEDPLAPFIPLLSLAVLFAISGGIWHLARTHRAEVPVPAPAVPLPEPQEPCRRIVTRLLDEAERDADGGAWAEAYRKTGRAVRVFVSHETGDGKEMTSTETEHLAGSTTDSGEGIRYILERCRIVGFAKGAPDPAEFRKMVQDIRAFLEEERRQR